MVISLWFWVIVDMISSPPQPVAGIQTWPVLMGTEFIHTASFPSSWSCTLQEVPLSQLLKCCETKPSASVCIQLPHNRAEGCFEKWVAELPKCSVSSKNLKNLTQPWTVLQPGLESESLLDQGLANENRVISLKKNCVVRCCLHYVQGNTLGYL